MIAKIRIICPKCFGAGVYKRTDSVTGHELVDPCPTCNGDKYLSSSYIDLTPIEAKIDDVLDKCNDILDKCNDILEQF